MPPERIDIYIGTFDRLDPTANPPNQSQVFAIRPPCGGMGRRDRFPYLQLLSIVYIVAAKHASKHVKLIDFFFSFFYLLGAAFPPVEPGVLLLQPVHHLLERVVQGLLAQGSFLQHGMYERGGGKGAGWAVAVALWRGGGGAVAV